MSACANGHMGFWEWPHISPGPPQIKGPKSPAESMSLSLEPGTLGLPSLGLFCYSVRSCGIAGRV